MPTLEKVQSDSLSSQIKQKMRDHEGLTHTEMEIAADLGLIDREQFWYWTPETQAQVRRAEADLKAGRYETFESVDDLFAALDNDGYRESVGKFR